MKNAIFCLATAMVATPLLFWSYKVLPRERWQIIASIPAGDHAGPSGLWRGTNLTFYGLFLASGSIMGVAVFLFLLSSIGEPMTITLTLISLVMILSLIGAKLIAGIVEKKQNTLTVAGGASVGLYLTPLAIVCYNQQLGNSGETLPLLPMMASLSIAYLIGEGIGRLACISFGCCYGKPVSELGPLSQRIFSRFSVSFHGDTKKIVYASGLGGVKVVPIQAITSFLYVNCGIFGVYLFLEGYFSPAFGVSAISAMAWRIFSEQLRADYRGVGKFTTYQWMGIVNIIWCFLLLFLSPTAVVKPSDLAAGISALWNPGVILFFQALWTLFFLYTGLSKVTGARLAFHVRKDNI